MRWLIAKAMAVVIPLRFDPAKAQGLDTTFGLRVRVRARPIDVAIAIAGGACTVTPGPPADAAAAASLSLADLIRLVLGDVGWPQLLSRGRFELSGDPFLAMRLPAVFRLPAGTRGASFARVSSGQPRLSAWARALSSFAASRPGSWFYLNVANPVDRRLLPATNGRLSLSVGQPVLCLEVVGAKSGKIRRTPLLFMADGEELVIVASATGKPRHPAWYRNLVANPRVKIYAPGGRSGEYAARTASGAERERLWNQLVAFYKGFDVYRGRTEGIRQIPVVVLSPSR